MGGDGYKIYTIPVGQITRKHGFSFHGYADDSNNYTAFLLTDPVLCDNALLKIVHGC